MKANSVLCTKCENWVYGECAKMKIVNARLATRLFAQDVRETMEGMVNSIEKLCDEMEAVNGFCYLGVRLYARGSCKSAVTARVRIDWSRFRECGEWLLGNRFPLQMKGKFIVVA